MILRLVAVVARMTTELEELKRAENSASLWKLHAESIVVLLEIARSVTQNAERVTTLADQRGARVEGDKLRAPRQKLHDCCALVEKTLTQLPQEKSRGANNAS